MKYRAVIFDFGNTLVTSGLPLNWQEFYRDALKNILEKVNLDVNPDRIQIGEKILLKYNTRINEREYEVSSTTIFSELLQEWSVTDTNKINIAIDTFFSFFLRNLKSYPDTEPVLDELKKRGMKVGVLTDVAYGTDTKYLVRNITNIIQYIDIFLSSSDIGFRKPNTKGYFLIVEELKVEIAESMYIGDEEKDIIGANKAGVISVLIDRNNQHKYFGQQYTIRSLREVLDLVGLT